MAELIRGHGSLVHLKQKSGTALVVSTAIAGEVTRRLQASLKIDGDLTFVKPPGEPWSDDVNTLGRALRSESVRRIIAIGGGSTIDFAKAGGLCSVADAEVEEFEFGSAPVDRVPEVVAAPTIPGSGSEATPYSVIRNSRTGRKFTVSMPGLLPTTIVLDADLYPVLNRSALMPSLLDAYCHALEAASNPRRTAEIGEAAASVIRRIGNELAFTAGRERVEVSDVMIEAGTDAGRCIAAARTGLPHTLAVALAEFSPLPHGLLVAHSIRTAHSAGLLESTPLDGAVRTAEAGMSDGGADGAGFAGHMKWMSDRLDELSSGSPLPRTAPAEVAHVVDRVLQDRGLPGACGGDVTRGQLEALVAGDIGGSHG